MDKRKVKRFIGKSVAVLAVAFAILSIVSKRKKRDTVYDNEPEQKNSLEGKKVIFVEDENDKENADGIRGHLEAIGDCDHKPGFYERYIKRGIDIVLSFGGLVVLSPVFALTALAIKIEDPGPVFFTQKRVGQNKKYFKLHKFRSMKMCTPHDVPTHMLDNPDQYITKVGKFIRAHSLDELPQIWDIFVGNMSVIGPRPGLWNQDLLTAERDKYGANDVKPGLTGWAQINGRDELEIPDKAKLDGEYVRKLGPIMDAKVFLGSLHVFGKDDSVVEGGTGEISKNKIYINKISDSILGKKILFLAPAFFGYENKIAKKMQEMGAYVDMYDVRSVNSAWERALLKVSTKIFSIKSMRYYDKIIKDNSNKDYDYILIVKCDMTPEKILKRFRTVYPRAKLCLYLWDSINNIPGIVNKFKYFDTLHSFDLEDCQGHRELNFRPLFYTDDFCRDLSYTEHKYDVSFIGTIHSDRYKVVKALKKIVAHKCLNGYCYCYLQSKFIYHFYKATKDEFSDSQIEDFKFEKKDSSEIADIVNQSKSVLDIQHPNQTGLTMRTIEMIGMNKKLITTNASIVNYDFYNKKNILIIDRDNPQIDVSFFSTPYEKLNPEIYQKYSLSSWILDVLS